MYNYTVKFFKEQDNRAYGKDVKKMFHKLLDISKDGINDFATHYKIAELAINSACQNISDIFCNKMVQLGEFIENYSLRFSSPITWFLPKQANSCEAQKETSMEPERVLPSGPTSL